MKLPSVSSIKAALPSVEEVIESTANSAMRTRNASAFLGKGVSSVARNGVALGTAAVIGTAKTAISGARSGGRFAAWMMGGDPMLFRKTAKGMAFNPSLRNKLLFGIGVGVAAQTMSGIHADTLSRMQVDEKTLEQYHMDDLGVSGDLAFALRDTHTRQSATHGLVHGGFNVLGLLRAL